ncbi:MAG: response regulator [Woeseiaceae bacterium]|nr:response regulator [Woeseiaceae bacterium]
MPKCRAQQFILVIDDNPADRELMRRRLRDCGVVVELVNNGKDALEFLGVDDSDACGKEPPDLILVDLNMPVVDGKQFMREYRGTTAGQRVPIVVFTSSDNVADVVESYDAGASSYVVKPTDLEPFRSTLDAVIRYWLEVSMPYGTGRHAESPGRAATGTTRIG